MSLLIPRWGPVGRFLNPGPFNMKEHAAIVIMASSASVSATSTLVIAAQKLYYGGYPNQGGAVFITMATQRMCSPFVANSNRFPSESLSVLIKCSHRIWLGRNDAENPALANKDALS